MRRTRITRPVLETLESRQMMSADLVGTAFDVTNGQPLPGGAVSVTFTVKNQNGFWFLDDAGAFQAKIYLSSDQIIGNAGDILVGASTYSGLGAGQSDTRTMQLAVPLSDPFLDDNDYRIGMVIDSDSQVAESNDSNNSNLGDGLDGERVFFEANVYSPVNHYSPKAPTFTLGQSLTGAIGGSDERMAALDIDAYSFRGTPGQTVAFDLDGGGWVSDLRLCFSNGEIVAENSGGTAPGEPGGNGESLLRYTIVYDTIYYLVVSGLGNNTSDPRLLTGRTPASQGAYTIHTLVLPTAPTAPDLDAAFDSGVSSTDNVTNSSSLRFSFTGQTGKIAQLFVDGALRGSDGNASGLYQITVNALSEGNHTVTANVLDPTTGYTSNLSAPLTVRVDTTAPLAAAPQLDAASDTGLSNSDKISNDMTPTFTGATEPNSSVQLYRNSALLASGSADSNGAWSITPTISADSACVMSIKVTDLAGNVSAISPSTSFTLDTVGPSLTAPMAFGFDSAPQRVTMTFSDDVVATLTSADLTVLDLATSGTVGATLAYNQAAHAATFTLAAPAPGVLPRGSYQATLNPAGVTDVAGNGVLGNTSLDFFFMPADGNRDRKVDLTDFTILASNFNQSGRTFSQGNFNYDAGGNVDLTDFTILAANFNQSLASDAATTSAAAAPAPSGASSFSPELIDDRLIDQLI